MTIKTFIASILAALTLASFGAPSARAGIICRNGLSSTNGIICRNGLTSINGIICRNGLAFANGLSSTNGIICRNGLSSEVLSSQNTAWVLNGIDPSKSLAQAIKGQ